MREEGCSHYIWESETLDCILYDSIGGIEYDYDPGRVKFLVIGNENKIFGGADFISNQMGNA